MTAHLSQSDNAERLAIQHRRRWLRPFAVFHGGVEGGYLAHQRDCQSNGKFRSTNRKSSRGACHDNAAIAGFGHVDVVHVGAGLGDDAEVRKLLDQLARETRSLPIRHEGIEATQRGRFAKRGSEDAYCGALPKPPYACGAFVSVMNVVKDRNPHG